MSADLELVKKELAPFLSPDAPEAAKSIALEHVLGLTGSPEGSHLIADSDILLKGVVSLTDDRRGDIQEQAYKCLVNLSANEEVSLKILKLEKYETKCIDWLKNIVNSEYKLADLVCKLLSNLTRASEGAMYVAEKVLSSKEISIDTIVLVLCNLSYNDQADLHYLASLLSNLSQVQDVRKHIMDKERCIIQRLLPFTEFHQSAVRRHGVVGALKNCCFDTEYHDWLLGDEVDILPRLLLPLAGPEEFDDDDVERLPDDLQYLYKCFAEYHDWLLGDEVDMLPWLLLPLAGPEEFDDDDVERLPDDLQNLYKNFAEYHDWLLGDEVDILPRLLLPLAGPEEFDDDDVERLPDDLQYLPPDKERDPNPRIRKMLVEALFQLCATIKGRRFLKEKNAYIIMREYYAWERKNEPANENAALNLIDVLIGDEPTEDMGDNLKELEIPTDVQEKFNKDDEIERQQNDVEQQQNE